MHKAVAKVAHAVGKEKWDLKVIERDKSVDKPTLERGMDGDDRVEQRSTYHRNGKLESRETREYLGQSNTVRYIDKGQWDAKGRDILEFRETNVFDNGKQTGGDGWQKDYVGGKLVKEVKRRWTVDSKSWTDFYVQEVAYYDNGDMKERVTTELDGNAKTRESWGSLKPNGGRNKSTQTWNGEKNRWD